MSLFQCDKCGVVENTALSDGARMFLWDGDSDVSEKVDESWKAMVGMDWRGKQFCSVCSPVWFTADGNFGVGPNPDAKWHGKFPQEFHPIGTKHTDRFGNIE